MKINATEDEKDKVIEMLSKCVAMCEIRHANNTDTTWEGVRDKAFRIARGEE